MTIGFAASPQPKVAYTVLRVTRITPAGRIGNNPAVAVTMQTKATFREIRFGLMVGIGGGVPCAGVDIRLEDVVVS